MKELIISHPSQLNSLSTLPLTGIKNVREIHLAGNMAEHPQKAEFEKSLNKQYHACGCDLGAKWLIVGFVASAGYEVFRLISYENTLTHAAVTVIGVTIAMAILGKLHGLYKANNQLKSTIQRIQKEWKPEKEFRENIVCG